MNIKKLLSCALLGLPMLALARPASPEVMTMTNPDGSIVSFRLHGNEDFNFCTDPDYTTILERNAEGYLKPAFRNGRMLTTNIADLNLLRSESLPLIQQRTEAINRMAQLDKDGRSTYTTVGEVPGLVILIEYADTPFTCEDPLDQFTRLCNEPGYSDYGSVGSARDYYIDASNGLFRPTFDVYGPVKLSHPRAFYTRYGTDEYDEKNANAYFGYAIQEAVKSLESTVDFKKYDVDDNGVIDNIFFFFSGRGQNDTFDRSCIWPHQADFLRYTVDPQWGGIGLDPLVVDGVTVRTYACSCELNSNPKIPSDPWIDGIGAFVHEYGHVLGLPDVYDVLNTGTDTPGAFDVMDTGSYNLLSARPPMFSAYEKWLCNWLEFDEAVNNTKYTLPSISTGKDAKAVRIRTLKPGGKPSNEYFIFESRTAEGWDTSLSQNGILIWHINYDQKLWEENRVNVNKMANIRIVRPEQDNRTFVVWPGDDNAYTYLTPETPDFKLTPYK
ncbi:MAG: M6 family metalloprotease domain-containing protein, partial [Muribaculaceae bacterium]|nr:M6 family metalloprotease domain-containing protein [Muribaculaceae bacterium]